jgi:hypothetical protein
MQHDAIDAAVLADGKSGAGKSVEIARLISMRRIHPAGVSASHRRSAPKSIQRFALDGEFMMSLPIPASNLAAS